MDDLPLCPLCQGPIPNDLAAEGAGFANRRLPSCGLSLVRTADIQENGGWVQLGSIGE